MTPNRIASGLGALIAATVLTLPAAAQAADRWMPRDLAVKQLESATGAARTGLGIDLNWYRDETMRFVVIPATSDLRPSSYLLAGTSVGAEASAMLGLGTGAAVLVGGGKRYITLQPVVVATSTGWGLAAGVGYLHLHPYGHDG